MNYTDYYLRFTDKTDADNKLLAASLLTEHSEELDPETNEVISPASLHPSEGVTMYSVGLIYEGGEWDEEGNILAEPTVHEGWHVNLRLRQPLTEEQEVELDGCILPIPNSPVAVFG